MSAAGLMRSRPWALAVLAAAIAAEIVWFAIVVRNGNVSSGDLVRPAFFSIVMVLLLVTGGRAALPVFLARMTVAGAFLNALWNRFDDFSRFVAYTRLVTSFMPSATITFLATAATVLEVVFCAALLMGVATRWMALGAAVLLFLFATAMVLSGLDQFEWAVYVLSAGAWVVAASSAPYVLSLDQLMFRARAARG